MRRGEADCLSPSVLSPCCARAPITPSKWLAHLDHNMGIFTKSKVTVDTSFTAKRRWSHLIIAIVHFGFAALFGFCFYDRFWAWREEIAQVETSFLTPDGSNVNSGGMVWALPSLVFACLGVIRIARYALLTNRISKAKQED